MPENNNIQEVENKSRVEQLLAAWAGGEQIELWAPQSNIERILMNILGATGVDINPIQSRNEALLLQILENGGGSGGGGSSDFSTATVTISGMNQVNADGCIGIDPVDDILVPIFDNGTYELVLYKGQQTIYITQRQANIVSVTGTGDVSVEFLEEDSLYVVTVIGDGTLTIVTEFA